MLQRRSFLLLLAMLMILLSGCGEDTSSPDVYVDPVRVELTVPTGHSLPLDERLLQADAFSDGKLLYSIDYTDKTIDQSAPDQLDLRYYIYDTATRETAELGKILWRYASNDYVVSMKNGKAYFAFDDCGRSSGIKIVEVDMQNNTITDRVAMEGETLPELAKISDTLFMYDIGQGIDIRTYSYYIYNTETNESSLFLTTQYNPETDEGKIPQCVRGVGEEIWVLVQVNGDTKQANVLERYSTDGKLLGTVSLPEEFSPYTDSDGQTYRISDFDIRGEQYYFYSDGTGDAFYYTQKNGEWLQSTASYGWGTLYPENDPQYTIYNYLHKKSCLYIENLDTGETVECHFNIGSEYSSIYRIYFDSSGKNDQIALMCATSAAATANEKVPYRVYFMNFSDIQTAIQQAQS